MEMEYHIPWNIKVARPTPTKSTTGRSSLLV